MRARVGLSTRAQKDWVKVDEVTRRRVMSELASLASNAPRAVDARPLIGAEPWQRLRVGTWRVIFRELSASELTGFTEDRGYLIERIIRRKDLDRATKGLR